MCGEDFGMTPAEYGAALEKKGHYGGVIDGCCIMLATGEDVLQFGRFGNDGTFAPFLQMAAPTLSL